MFQIAKNVSLAAAAAQTAVQPTVTPFIPGRNATLVFDVDGLVGATVKVQGSDDGTTYADVATVSAQGPVLLQNVTIQAYMRLNVTTAGSAGKASAYLLASP
jgi:hypothetical protein